MKARLYFFRFILLIISSIIFLFKAQAQNVTITVNSTNYQTIEGIGGGIVYYQNWVTAHANKVAIYDTVFNGLGLSGLRIGNWAQDLNADLSQDVEIINAAKARLGNDFFLEMSSWSAPAELKANGTINGTNGGSVKASLKKENGVFVYDQFGTWWRQSLDYYHSNGIYPDYISIQNEPDMDATYEATLFNPTESTDIAAYGKALEAVAGAINGMPNEPKILGPEPLGVGWNATQNYVNALDKSLLDGYCFHYYHSGVQTHTDRYSYPDDYIAAMTALNNDLSDKPMFMTENCSMRDHLPQDAVSLAWLLANSFNINRVSSYLFWDLLWGPNGSCVEVENPWQTFTTTEGFIVNPEYHGLRHFSKFIKQGWICLGVSSSNSDVVTAAFKSPQSDAYSVVIINKGSSSHDATLTLPTGAPTDGSVIQTVPSSSIWSNVLGAYSSGNTISLPANSITTIALESNDVTKPTVTINSPVSSDVLITNNEITITADATDTDGTIQDVKFYANSILIGTDNTYPYTMNWTPTTIGENTISVTATDNDLKTSSTSVIVMVNVPQAPYGGIAHAIPGTIEFEEYDEGGNGFAYFDDSPGSETSVAYRTTEDVDIEVCTDTGGGYSLGYTTAGEWLEYTCNVATTGMYTIELRVACNDIDRTLSLQIGGNNIATDIAIPNTTAWDVWQTVTIENVNLTAGEQIMKVTIGATDYVNLNNITFTQVSAVQAIELKEGWNLIGFPKEISANVETALSSIINNVDVIKDQSGFWKAGQAAFLNSLTTLEWGKGYFLKVTADCTLEW